MGYLYIVNCELAGAVVGISSHANRLFESDVLELLLNGAEKLDANADKKARRDLDLLEKEEGDLTPAEYFLAAAQTVTKIVSGSALKLSSQLAAVEKVTSEIATYFDGQDPREPKLIEQIERARTAIHELIQKSGGSRGLDPDAKTLTSIWEAIERSFKYFRLLEPALGD
jgi:hypothetical protein